MSHFSPASSDASVDSRISSPLGIAVIAIGGVAVLLFLAQYYTLAQRDPKEPPFIAPRIPLIGHLISQFTEGSKFFRRLKYDLPCSCTRNPPVLTPYLQ